MLFPMNFGIYQIIHSILSFFGVAINILLLFLAITKSPKLMRPCSALITNKALTDIMSSLANFFVMQRIFSNGDTVTIIPTGPCTYFGPTACYAGHMFMISFLEHNLIWLLACYLFRYYILYVCDPKIKSIILAAILVYTPSLIHTAIWANLYKNEITENNAIKNESIDEQLRSNNLIITGTIVRLSSIVVFSQLIFTSFIVLFAYLWIRNVLINFIIKMGGVITKDVKALNKALVKILTFQVCIPFWIFLGVTFFLLMFMGISGSKCFEYSITISFMMAPVISPFSYILFVPHYWNWCIGKEMTKQNGSTVCSTTNCNEKSMASINKS